MTNTLNELAKSIRQNAVDHGFWEEDRNFGEMLALIHSEVSEALESYRKGEPSLFLVHSDDCQIDEFGWCTCTPKPEGWTSEIIDVLIRSLDLLHEQVNIDHVTSLKMKYNTTRPYKHGKKF